MAPREATHSFPDHFLTVDYDHSNVVAPILTVMGGTALGQGGMGGGLTMNDLEEADGNDAGNGGHADDFGGEDVDVLIGDEAPGTDGNAAGAGAAAGTNGFGANAAAGAGANTATSAATAGDHNGIIHASSSDDFEGMTAQQVQLIRQLRRNHQALNTTLRRISHHRGNSTTSVDGLSNGGNAGDASSSSIENDPLSAGAPRGLVDTSMEGSEAVLAPAITPPRVPRTPTHASQQGYSSEWNRPASLQHLHDGQDSESDGNEGNGPGAILFEHHHGGTAGTPANYSNDNDHSPSSISQSNGLSSYGFHQHVQLNSYATQPTEYPHQTAIAHRQDLMNFNSNPPTGANGATSSSSSQSGSPSSASATEPPSQSSASNAASRPTSVSTIAEATHRLAMAQQVLARSRRHSSRRSGSSVSGEPAAAGAVPRASSFGGFSSFSSSPSRAASSSTAGSAHNSASASVDSAVAAAASSNLVTPSSSRSNSMASTHFSRQNSLHGSLHTSLSGSLASSTASGYHHQRGMSATSNPQSGLGWSGAYSSHGHSPYPTSPQEGIEDGASVSSAVSAATAPAGTLSAASTPIHDNYNHGNSSPFATSPGFHNLSPILANHFSGNDSPYLPFALAHAGSVLDQTSFPEEEEEDDDDELDFGYDVSDKYSPIGKLAFDGKSSEEDEEEEDDNASSQNGEKVKAVKDLNETFATMDTTADGSTNGSFAYGGYTTEGTTSYGMGIGLGASHVIHEESPSMEGVPNNSTSNSNHTSATTLRPRPTPYSHVGVSSSLADDMSNDSSHASGAVSPSHEIGPNHRLLRNQAFELSPNSNSPPNYGTPPSRSRRYRHQDSNMSDITTASNETSLTFGTDTTIQDLTYYAEQGCIVDLLAALTNPHLKTLGARMLADYAKMPHRRVAVASNSRILEFVQSTALEIGTSGRSPSDHVQKYTSQSWLGREYAVETVRSLTAAEENDRYLMNAPGLLQMLALVAGGGPFVQKISTSGYGPMEERVVVSVPPPRFQENGIPRCKGVASDKARLHACIAIMNLSCGKSNKVEITNITEILEAMRDVMLGRHFTSTPKKSSSPASLAGTIADEARLKATTCIKNLSNADANDAALLGTPGLVETLGFVAEATCHPETGATTCTTHACLALMNLSISKANKNRVFRTPGVMDALMAVITRTAPKDNVAETTGKNPSFEARVKACSALSNLAIGYDNKIPMFNYPGFVESILHVIRTDEAEARTKACSILWSFAAEMKNQVPVVQRGDILPALVSVAKEDTTTEARFKCVAALTLLAESPENAVPLLHAGSLEPLMNVLQEAGPDPTQWRGQTASWCVGFLMNMAQCDEVVPALLAEGIVDLLAPLIALDHYQSLKAAMAVTFVCRYDTGDRTYNLLRQTENVIPKIISLLHNTLSGRGGSGYKYGVFTLRSSVGCISSLASGPDFMKERIATGPVFESLLRVVSDFCVDGGTPGAIVGGGRDDTRSATLAVRALSLLTGHLIPEPGCTAMPFGPVMDEQLITALRSFELSTHPDIEDETRAMAHSARIRIEGGKNVKGGDKDSVASDESLENDLIEDVGGIGLSFASKCCGMHLHAWRESSSGDYTGNPVVAALPPPTTPAVEADEPMDITDASSASSSSSDSSAVRTFLLTDDKTGRRFAVPCDPSGGRAFNDNRVWCFRRGRWCKEGEEPDKNFQWSDELQAAYMAAINEQGNVSPSASNS
mmetsp:Transcript_22705/g.47899  ORF Transcript_22705/g.47899 Transcript_22705/m.47899 type:complete len:1715 (-) Transcript_22705:911-6055(-)|eukprot:CAMPEP_0171335104 /NCGR_PEP_ID=MMETSP0878-20121228/5108_1 /TAXON_ID=67004 /ORGANISM="Thalassiosira weissflogii, Strain CCMP1336" /LENGTH=1714 /DNA_ID=CAMNT_0011836315 /DNA_START=846 /DNA_END=5990 /DNA_ORIENTATION=+